jgi:TonB-dependent receptor
MKVLLIAWVIVLQTIPCLSSENSPQTAVISDSTRQIAALDSNHVAKDTLSSIMAADPSHETHAPDTNRTIVGEAVSSGQNRDSVKKTELSPTNTMEKSVVVGRKDGQSSALGKQKNSDNLKNVIDAELIAKLPDQSTADALQRVPGISVQRDQGEGHYVMIRGTESRLSTVTINGQSVSSPDGSTRAVPLNVIPADQLAEIEVAKVLMPEMDADAIGGTINLITNTAKDSVARIKARFTPGYSQMPDKPLWEGSLSAGKRLLNNTLGVYAGGSYSDETRESQGIAATWDPDLVLNTGDTTLSHAAGKHLWSLMFRDYQRENERIAGNSKIDYRLSPLTDLFLSGSYNQYDTRELRRSLFFDMHNGDATPIGAANGSGSDLVEKVPVTRSLKDSEKKQAIANVTFGGKTTLIGEKIDGCASYSRSETDQPHDLTSSFGRQNETFLFYPSGDSPQFTPIDLSTYQMNELFHQKEVFKADTTFNNPSQYSLSDLELKEKHVKEVSVSGQGNITLQPFQILNGSLEIKGGAKGSEHSKDQSLKVTTYTDSGNFKNPNLGYFLGNYSNTLFFNGQYVLNNMPDQAKMRDFVNTALTSGNGSSGFLYANSANHQLEEDPQTYRATDRNAAGYLQAKLNWGELTVIGGARFEYTSMHYSGLHDTTLGFSNDYVYSRPTEMFRSFFFPLPMILARYSPLKNLNARLSYTHTFSRPNWDDMIPATVFTTDDGELQVNQGNPDLRPTQAHNVDIGFEYYPTSQDMVSFGGFYKKMKDYIFDWEGWYDQASHSPFANTGAVSTGSHAPIIAYTKLNGDYADLAGFEFSVMQRFLFLPGFLNGLGINGNYCFTWSQTKIPGNDKFTSLPGQSDHVGNISLFYEKYGFSARLALNLQSAYIYELKAYVNTSTKIVTPYPDYTDNHAQLDCALSQKLPGNITALLEFNNLTNAPSRLYMNSTDYLSQKEYYSWTVHAGVKVDLNL